MTDPIEVQVAVLAEQVRSLRQIVEAASYIAKTANENSEKLAIHEERFRGIHEDVAAIQERLDISVSRVEKSCNALGDLIRAQAEQQQQTEREQVRLKTVQEQEAKQEADRRSLLYGVAGAFTATALGVIAHVLHLL